MVAAWKRIRGKLKKSSTLVSTKRAIWTTSRRIRRGCDGRILEGFPLFVPASAGSFKKRAQLAVKASNQVFPLILDLTSLNGWPTETPVAIETLVDTEDKRIAAAQLKTLFDHYRSDKAAQHYHLLYGSILADPNSVTNLLEIGIGTNYPDVVSNMRREFRPGASLRAFRTFLPRATIYGADIDERILFEEDRIRTFVVDQTERESWDSLSTVIDQDFDLIIDDGLHSPNANIATLLFGLGRLKIGGWLVVEDIPAVALPLWQVISALLPEQYESRIVAAPVALLFSVRRSTERACRRHQGQHQDVSGQSSYVRGEGLSVPRWP